MAGNTKSFDAAHNDKLKGLSKEERAKAGLKKLAQEIDASKGNAQEPEGLASGATDKDGKMIVDLEEGHNDNK